MNKEPDKTIPEGYTVIPEEVIKARDEICTPLPIGKSSSIGQAKRNTSYFMYHQIGMKPYAWQHMLFDEVLNGDKDILVNTIRQAGKSAAVEILSLQYAVYNLKPVPSKGYTVVGIASSTEAQQKKIIEDIRDLMDVADAQILQKSQGKVTKFFNSRISKMARDTNSKFQITLRQLMYNPKTKQKDPIGKITGVIKCVQATQAARGNTFSILFMDEAAFFTEDNFFDTVARPTLKATGGKAVITTTPNGQKGWFFKVFDPFDDLEYNSFKRFWLHYNHIESDYEYMNVIKLRKDMIIQGAEKRFQQEYEAMFTADNESFFDSDKVDEATDHTLQKWDSYQKATDMGIDFGFKVSNTVITITRFGEDKVSRLVFDKVYPPEKDHNMLGDVKELIKKFNVKRIIVDDCAAGSFFIQQAKKEGLPLHLMSFKRDKQTKYFLFRAKLYQGKIKYYSQTRLLQEMKGMTAVEQQVGTKICKPKGGSDDIIDSFLMSVYYQIEDNKGFKLYNY